MYKIFGGKEKKERGVAMLEMCFVAWLYLLFLIPIVDILYAIHAHTQLYQVVKEGVRGASNIPYMERGSWRCILDLTSANVSPDYGCAFESTTDMTQCYVPDPHPAAPGYLPVPAWGAGKIPANARLLILINQMLRFQYSNNTLGINKSIRITTCADYSNTDLGRMSVKITASYDGVFFLFQKIGIKVKASGPYST